MDVRCEKCQTEYELDEARLKPGGVTVKCTNCGHMFKIRKRTTTNVGAPAVTEATRARSPSAKPAAPSDSLLGDDTVVRSADAQGEERQWLIRLENGDQKSCRELATLQQWIVAGVVTRESLISRTGKTWKRLGDITELAQYFTIADEARSQRQQNPTTPAQAKQAKATPGTLLGIGVSAAGGTILPDDEDELRTTGSYRARGKTEPPPPPVKGGARPPPGSELPATASAPEPAPAPARRPPTQPPPPPRKSPSAAPAVPASNRSTGAWVSDSLPSDLTDREGPAGPLGGRIKADNDEPAFAGRVRVMPTDEASFSTGKVPTFDDDDGVLPERRGSRGGLLLVFVALLVMGAAAGAVYVFVIKKDSGTQQVTTPAPADAQQVATADDAATVVTPLVDAADEPPPTAVDTARAALAPDREVELRDALKALDGVKEPGVEAMRVHLAAAIAQGLLDRAAISADKSEAEKLKKEAKQLVLDVAAVAQRAHKATPEDPAANLAMAHVLRLQGKAARDLKRYLDTAKAKATPPWYRDVALAEALVLVRDGKLDDAMTALAAIDQGDNALEATGDVRARFQRARVAYAQDKADDARPLVEQVLAAQPDHAGAKALAARLETSVAKTDPLPPEDPGNGGGSTNPSNHGGSTNPSNNTGGGAAPGDSYDRLLAKANAAAERNNCSQALELFTKALEQKPNGVEALTGMGYCHIDAKQFASAFSKFRAALAVSSRYEPALWGVGEAYMQQGRKEQAIEAIRKYLEVYPGTTKATKALDRLGANSGAQGGGQGSGSATTTPPDPPAGGSGGGATEPTPPAPTPAPTPAPAPAPAPTDPPAEN